VCEFVNLAKTKVHLRIKDTPTYLHTTHIYIIAIVYIIYVYRLQLVCSISTFCIKDKLTSIVFINRS